MDSAPYDSHCCEGWQDLVKQLILSLPKGVSLAQVKQKFGVLRVYVDTEAWVCDATRDHVSAMIKRAQDLSAKMCSLCGDPGRLVGQTHFVTLCEHHESLVMETKPRGIQSGLFKK